MENLNAEQIVIEIQGLIKALKANNGWWENRGRGGWFNHDILVDAVAVITSQEQRIKELTEENERLKAEVSVKKKLLDEAENRYKETAKRFYKEGVKDMKSEIKKTLSALCKGDVSEIHRMIDQIAKEIEEGV